LWLAGLLILVLAVIALSPFWAPQIAPLFPWGENREEYAALTARVAAVETRPVQASNDVDSAKSATSAVARRVDQLETAINARLSKIETRPTPQSVDVDEINSAVNALTHRVDHLEAAANADGQVEGAVAALREGGQQLEKRLAEVETQSASRMASETAALHDSQQELSRLGKVAADLRDRVAALEREEQAQNRAELRAAGMLTLLLGQMREAVEQARPFPTEFNAFIRLAGGSELAAAAEPLAAPARNGVASHAVLTKRLADLAGQIAAANEPAGEPGWGSQILARLRGLVTIRRLNNGSLQSGPEAAVTVAQAALARNDLAGAVAALEPLTGPTADAARPWLQMARERLTVEGALDHLQELLTARLGSPPGAPVSAPPKAPDERSEKARTRS
jgi:hypothetical protein